jgi:hypothetical protein
MTHSELDFETRLGRALEECKTSLYWWGKAKETSRSLHQISQVATVGLSALTPILILAASVPKWAQALPAALATIAATLDSIFHWREHWVRRAYTLEALQAELARFETRTSTYGQHLGDEEALSTFVERITTLNVTEVINWGDTQIKRSGPDLTRPT